MEEWRPRVSLQYYECSSLYATKGFYLINERGVNLHKINTTALSHLIINHTTNFPTKQCL